MKREATIEIGLFSLFGTLTFLLTLSDDDDCVVNDLGLDRLSKRCWNERNLCHCPIDSSLRDNNFGGGGHSRRRLNLG